ncbi:MAG: signal peptide peptidase SppA [Proteobacteria bacterium]|nr:signal peptide peptidase SppA [Pseudomonadota bacterium]
MVETNKKEHVLSTEERFFLILRLDKSRRRWKFLALIFLILSTSFFLLKYKSTEENIPVVRREYIAEININGIILEDRHRLKVLESLKNSHYVKAVILNIDSPGGAMVPGLELMDALKALGKEKPLVVQMRSVAASAGYLVSLSGEYIVANEASITGSLGVMIPLIDATVLADKIGVKSAEVTSGPLKSITSPFSKRSQRASIHLQRTVSELQKILISKVKERRDISPTVEQIVSDGRFFTGQTALTYNLIDDVGNRQKILDYLYNVKKLDNSLKIVEVPLKKKKEMRKWDELFADELVSSIINQLQIKLQSMVLAPQFM